MRYFVIPVVVGLLLATLIIGASARVNENEAVRNDPPAACQLLGGQWSVWSGWRCA